MSARPLIGVICCARHIGDMVFQAVAEKYLDAVIRLADVDAVLLPSLPRIQNTPSMLRRLDGVMLTGSPSNVAPRLYGDMRLGNGPFDEGRDSTAFGLIERAITGSKPLFGICRGFQEVNVALGGSLVRDLGDLERPLSHHAPGDVPLDVMFDYGHAVSLVPGGVLETALGVSEIGVNSVHYQGIDRLSPELAAEALSPDGVVEAVRLGREDGKLLAVQWHPEWNPDANPVSRKLYALFGAMVRGATLRQAVTEQAGA